MIRHKTMSEHGLFPASVGAHLEALPNYSKWSKALCSQKSVTYVFDAPAIAERMRERVAKMKAERK